MWVIPHSIFSHSEHPKSRKSCHERNHTFCETEFTAQRLYLICKALIFRSEAILCPLKGLPQFGHLVLQKCQIAGGFNVSFFPGFFGPFRACCRVILLCLGPSFLPEKMLRNITNMNSSQKLNLSRPRHQKPPTCTHCEFLPFR